MIRLGLVIVLTLPTAAQQAQSSRGSTVRPNIVVILADDLGYGELGCYGQKKIATPHLDRLASEGIRFTHHYAGNPVCAPSRCALLTGFHNGHGYVRANSPWARKRNPHREGQEPIPAATFTVAESLKGHGYATACIGKWGLGGPGTEGAPDLQGFDLFYGYLCQAQAHNYYPDHLWRNAERVALQNRPFAAHQEFEQAPGDYARFAGEDFAPDLCLDEALGFLRANKAGPFFLYYPTVVPHVALQVPADSPRQYPASWDEKPYLGSQGYLPNARPRATYAAMITRMDRDVGRILAELDALGLRDNTLVIFTSDNGPAKNGGADPSFFASAAGLRGRKGSVYEGGIRVPFIARWPGEIEPGSASEMPSSFQDFFPTCLDVLGAEPIAGLDGVSLLPAMRGSDRLPEREYLYWALGKQQALRQGDWKLVRIWNKKRGFRAQLFDLKSDPIEAHDVAADHPEVLATLVALMDAAHRPSKVFPCVYDSRAVK